MRNLPDVQCPQCGNADWRRMQAPCDFCDTPTGTEEDLFVIVGMCVESGPYLSPEEERDAALRAEAEYAMIWDVSVRCDACGYEAPIVSFNGAAAERVRKLKAVWGRFLEFSPPALWRP